MGWLRNNSRVVLASTLVLVLVAALFVAMRASEEVARTIDDPEGVEDEATLRMLIDDGCDIGQGYFFSRPCPAEELTTWLTDSQFGVRVNTAC